MGCLKDGHGTMQVADPSDSGARHPGGAVPKQNLATGIRGGRRTKCRLTPPKPRNTPVSGAKKNFAASASRPPTRIRDRRRGPERHRAYPREPLRPDFFEAEPGDASREPAAAGAAPPTAAPARRTTADRFEARDPDAPRAPDACAPDRAGAFAPALREAAGPEAALRPRAAPARGSGPPRAGPGFVGTRASSRPDV